MAESTNKISDWFESKVVLPAFYLIAIGLLLGLSIGFFLLWLALYKRTLPYLLAPVVFELVFFFVFIFGWSRVWRPRIKTYTRHEKLLVAFWILIFSGPVISALVVMNRNDPGGRKMMDWISSWAYPLYKSFR